MTDETRVQLDDALRTELRTARADLSRLRYLARKYGEFMLDVGPVLISHPENLTIDAKTGITGKVAGYYLMSQQIPKPEEIVNIVGDIQRAIRLVESLSQDMRDRGLTE